jgi:methyl-accepting chemotaxis protein
MTISHRIWVLTLLPIILLIGFFGWLLFGLLSDEARTQRLMLGASTMDAVSGLTSSVQIERGRSAQFLSSKGAQYHDELTAQRAQTEASRGKFAETTRAEILAQLRPNETEAVNAAAAALEGLNGLRDDISNQRLTAGESTARYSALVDKLIAISLVIVRDADQAQAKDVALAFNFLQSAGEHAARTRGIGAGGLSAGSFTTERLARLAGETSQESELIKLFDLYAPAGLRSAFAGKVKTAAFTDVDRYSQIILAAEAGKEVKDVDGKQWFQAATARVDVLRNAQDELLQSLVAQIAAAHSQTILKLLIASLVAFIVIGAIAGLAIATMRSISRPIRAMASTMSRLAVGDHAIEIDALDRKDEIGEMAKAVLVFRDAARQKVKREKQVEEERRRLDDEHKSEETGAIERERSLVTSSIGASLAKLAAKDLSYRIVADLPPAYRQLQTDFNTAMEQLEDAVIGFAGSVQAIESGSRQIAGAADDLSHRTETQAASLEQTAAAVNEITASVNAGAESSNYARKVVALAKDDADRSGVIVGKAMVAMDNIAKSSQEISQIIVVIDEIAFQTNLLALNAGVEAARAGETGRGFAVIASEVRALAQRSAEAAKEIKGLISTSSSQVSEGVVLVGEAGETLKRIVAQVVDLNNVVSTVAAGVKERSIALGEVNAAVHQMEELTQRNAAVAEETTAASHQLQEESERLIQLIARFRIGDSVAHASSTDAETEEESTLPEVA